MRGQSRAARIPARLSYIPEQNVHVFVESTVQYVRTVSTVQYGLVCVADRSVGFSQAHLQPYYYCTVASSTSYITWYLRLYYCTLLYCTVL